MEEWFPFVQSVAVVEVLVSLKREGQACEQDQSPEKPTVKSLHDFTSLVTCNSVFKRCDKVIMKGGGNARADTYYILHLALSPHLITASHLSIGSPFPAWGFCNEDIKQWFN